jgi:hypothetical protein
MKKVFSCGPKSNFGLSGCGADHSSVRINKYIISNDSRYSNVIFELCDVQMSKFGIRWFKEMGYGNLKRLNETLPEFKFGIEDKCRKN